MTDPDGPSREGERGAERPESGVSEEPEAPRNGERTESANEDPDGPSRGGERGADPRATDGSSRNGERVEPASERPGSAEVEDARAAAGGSHAGARAAMAGEETDVAAFEEGTSQLSRAATTTAALVAAVALVPLPVAAAVALVGALVVTAAVRRSSRRLLDYGVGTIVLAALLAGVYGVGPEALLVSVAAALVTYDVGETGITVGAQLGRRARTRRLELGRVATSVATFGAATTVVYSIYRLSDGASSAAVVTLLLVGSLVVAAALR